MSGVTSNDNPAGRLYSILERFYEASGQSVQVARAWGSALGVSDEDAPGEVARASSLLSDLEQAVSYLNRPGLQRLLARWLPTWSRPFFPTDRSWTSGSNGLISETALDTLSGLADTLADLASEGTVPPEEAIPDLRQAIQEAIDAVRAEGSVPRDLRTMMLRRLHDILWAPTTWRYPGRVA